MAIYLVIVPSKPSKIVLVRIYAICSTVDSFIIHVSGVRQNIVLPSNRKSSPI